MKKTAKIKAKLLMFIGTIFIIIYGCEKNNDNKEALPVLTTINVTEITLNTAISGGEIITDNGYEIISRGICWSKNENPTIKDNKTSDGNGVGLFTSVLNDLTPNTKYYIRAYATNSAGTSYGDQKVFKTFTGTVTDVDGNVYYTVTIGSQIWMAENLKVTHYRNGEPIGSVSDGLTWGNYGALNLGAFCDYENNSVYGKTYGKLYNWYAANDSRNICPTGWRIPTKADWEELIFPNGVNIGTSVLKETGLLHWGDPNESTNESGFTALPGGKREADGRFLFKEHGYWWSTTRSNSLGGLWAIIDGSEYVSGELITNKGTGCSIRCIKN